ncbi:tRNA cyclic N6-threonylcarbamoyladenosine(37) synthase TcdA [Paraferrimonas sedimenticola]|uniref:tRNA threonylcarbamoyladenosine dehydratase n=1 Tax=Paraferrimonas sedimenticola TaxID=375674 RepID=A0AA37RYY5_9GAMM|nr:tRNA cyclic N6-threonylcarbamoyladenosine(37) synthase TcdA [Paraferrimonas sedimenticola]GLP97292.1 tRNA cyclic N6-threonylcarbamoyladenosine(37) synthase TcdA [Paraferrimonas sedimenticola]
MSEAYQMRFGGIGRLYGRNALSLFAQSHVMVIGIGGVGTWAAEALARSGIGHLSLVDLDDICITNTNRQTHALSSTIGESKVEVMAERITAINPECKVAQFEDFVSSDNLAQVLASKPDYVVDCIDSVAAKVALIAYCKRYKIKLISVGGAGGQMDPTQVQVCDLAKSYQDPLLAKVRNQLRRDHGFSKNPKRKFSVECVFSTEQLTYPSADGQVCQQKPQNGGSMRMDCASGFGAVTPVTGTFGFVAASRVLAKLAKRAESTHN